MTGLSKLCRILSITIIPLLCAAVCAFIVWIIPGDYDHDLAALVNKRDLLISKKPPRIIFIGGSNLVTLDGRHIEGVVNEKTTAAYSVVNMGLWGGLDMARYLDAIKGYCRPGDMVIICQEYATLLSDNYFHFIKRNDVADTFFFLMKPERVFRGNGDYSSVFGAMKNIILLDQLKIKTYIQALTDGAISKPCTGGYYRYRENYSPHGDRKTPFPIRRPLGESGFQFQEPKTDNLLYLKDFHDYARSRGIRVFFSFPPFPIDDYRLNRTHIDSLVHVIRDRLGIDILMMPEATVSPESCFANTVNHLLPPCEKNRTGRLAEQLNKRI
ncbi:MAG TPA: hypothetical protein PLM53_01110 [Spirochaetota bacterium]|nr:hypothetical protein [Spirochaetota bacterium]HQF10640.1 hypothetical protein [Spirochaetota bacterium]HQH95666.1 hypothetical protein [Spirochaetota bacterium]HQJ73224.1 hypothetical protein [Spirochaetota bacterium]